VPLVAFGCTPVVLACGGGRGEGRSPVEVRSVGAVFHGGWLGLEEVRGAAGQGVDVLFGGTRCERDAIDGGVLDEPAVDDGAMLM